MVTNLRCADDVILLATSEAELQELVDRLDRVSREYSLLINVEKTKLNCERRHLRAAYSLIQTEQLEHVPLVPDYRRWWVYDGIPYQVKQRAGDRKKTR